ncbi:uncharacterized protein LOC126162281 [Schistocerca cancellata]|uniref:uncharacterized protein LOC126162281 n=1 Tax=Schistocerca cancellata TaxID=274614 RepID=UPI002118046E|nr:uncharacterized protein LOC126162281 [Schistocerca cancellata]XP_049774660.1 uncharacterized protein LOC126162281 [Schistocerca cancellata]
MCGDSGQPPIARTRCRALQMLLLLLLAVAAPAAAAPVTSAEEPASTSTEATTVGAGDRLLESLTQKERAALMAYELAAALQQLAEQEAEVGDVTEEATARIVTRQGDASDYSDAESREETPATTPLHRALALQPYSATTSVAKSISLSKTFQSILNRWVQARSNVTYYKVVKVNAKITICFPFNVCFEIQDPWGLCCPF